MLWQIPESWGSSLRFTWRSDGRRWGRVDCRSSPLCLGGFTAFSCGFSTILAGIAAGYLGRKTKITGEKNQPTFAVMIGMILETIQMIIILIAAKPFELALNFVQIIGLPMIFVNGFGTLLFMLT